MTVRSYTSFDQIDDATRYAFSYACQNNIFRSLEWFRLLCEHSMPEDLDLRIYHAAGDANPRDACLMFFYRTSNGEFSSLTNCYTMEYTVAFSREDCDKAALINKIVDHIGRERPRWNYVNIRFLYSHQDETELLLSVFRNHGFAVNSFFKFENYFTLLDGGDFAGYYAQRPSRVRNTITRREKKLAAAHSYHWRIVDRLDTQDAEDYARVYALSWKEPEEYPHFTTEMCRVLADLGLLRVGLLYVDDQPAAAQIWLLSGRKAIIYKLAYDEKFKEYSVGSILTREMVKAVMERDQIDELDYGVGSEPYKTEWMDQKRILVGLEAFNMKTISGAIMALTSSAKSRFRDIMKAR